MSSAERQVVADSGEAADVVGGSLLDAIMEKMPRTVEKPEGDQFIRALVEQSLQGSVQFDRSVTQTIKQKIRAIDAAMSTQLSAIMHQEAFQKLEGTWRGLHYLVKNSETGSDLKLRVLNVSKKELIKDFEKATEFDQSVAFKKIYEAEFGTPGGEPYGALVGDYEFTNHPQDVKLLASMAEVSAAAFCPFVTSAGPELLGLDSYQDLAKPRDLESVFLAPSYAKWRSFRDSDDSRFVVLTMPRTLARLPYGQSTKPVEEFGFEEVELNERGQSVRVDHSEYCWMSTAYVMGARLTDAFAKTGWCTAIRGAENGGRVEDLPTHNFIGDDGDEENKCPTEIAITDRREGELAKLGFLPLSHYKNTDYSVFFGGQSCQKPRKFDRTEATANAVISAKLPYMMASSRIAHYLKVIARDKIGSFMERDDCEKWLNRWIANYVCLADKPTAEDKARLPLAEANITVEEIPGSPGSYNAVAHLRPWLQLEELTTSLRMVARIPRKK